MRNASIVPRLLPLSAVFFFLAASVLFAVDPLTTSAASLASNGSSYTFGKWSNSSVTVTLACVAGSSNCLNISYCTDTSNTCNPTSGGTAYNGSFNISTEGVSYIRYASNNSTGGWGDTGSSLIEIDTVSPSISISDGASSTWTNSDTIAVSVSDDGSGLTNTSWFASTSSSCGSSQDDELDSGTNGTSMTANSDSDYLGKYVCFRAMDLAGNKNYAVSSKITRLDTTVPIVNAGTDQDVNSAFTQNGVASDSGSGVSSYWWSQVSGPGTITFGSQGSQSTTISASADGSYVVKLTATDAAGNSASSTFNLDWITSAPGIDISSPSSSPAQSKTVTASVPSGTLSMAITTGSACDSSLSFVSYQDTTFSSESDNGKSICYKEVDSLGNVGYKMSDKISGIDTTKPVISLNGDSSLTLQFNSSYTDAGATATDSLDGVISTRITVGGNPVNVQKLGTYVVTYDVSDSAGNKAVEVTRTVKVVDTTPPVITLLGNSTITMAVGSNYTDAGATAWDNYDGVITSKIVESGRVDASAAGTYNITYGATDSSGNQAQPAVRTVVVVDNFTGLLEIVGLVILALAVVIGGIGVIVFLFFRKGRSGGGL